VENTASSLASVHPHLPIEIILNLFNVGICTAEKKCQGGLVMATEFKWKLLGEDSGTTL
jgi:hypothetical protein